jgi:hypothetical protein
MILCMPRLQKTQIVLALAAAFATVHALADVASQRLSAGPPVAALPATRVQASAPLPAGGKAPTPQGAPATADFYVYGRVFT